MTRLPTIRPDSGAATSIAPAIGSVYRPASNGERPRDVCRYRVLRNRKPPIAANIPTAVTEAPANGAERKKRTSISGWRRRSS